MGASFRGEAQPLSPAQQAVRDAEASAKHGDFIAAAASFRQAFAADPKPEYLCNIGVAYHKSKQEPARAQLFLSRCQERNTLLDQKFVEAVRAALSAAEATMRAGAFTPVDITVEPSSTKVQISAFDPDETFVGPRAVWLPYGKHTVTFTADAYETQQVEVDASSHKGVVVNVTLQRKPTDTGSGSDTAGSAAGSGSNVVTVVPPTSTSSRPSKILPIASTAVTVGLVALAVVTNRNAKSRADLSAFPLDAKVAREDKNYISRQNTYMVVSGSLAFVGAGITSLLWYRALRTPSTHVELTATGNNGSVSLSGRF